MKAAHLVRRPDAAGRQAAVKHKRAPVAEVPAVQYPAGYFLALVRQHNWPPRFEPAATGPVLNLARPSQQCRANGGFDRAPLNLPGAVAHLAASGKA